MNKVVIHVMGMDSSKYGGIERFNVALSRSLAEKDIHSVFVYESAPANKSYIVDIRQANGEIVVLNARQHPIRFCLGFVKLIKQYCPELVHAHFTKARFYAIPIAYMLGVRRLFFTIHSMMEPLAEIKPLTRLWYRWANKKSKVIAVSDNIATVYRDNWPRSVVRRIYMGVAQDICNKEISRKRLKVPQGQMMLLTVANFNFIKGLDILCEAVKLLKKQDKWIGDACLYIVGQPESDIQELQKLIDELGVLGSVRMMGISNEVGCYMSAADVYVQSSRSEGLPLALMEATSYSLPIVGTKVGGIPEIVRDGYNGFLVDSENSRELSEALFKLMKDGDLRSKFGNHSGIVFRESFSIDRGVDQTMAYYNC